MELNEITRPLVIIGAILVLVCTFMVASAIRNGARTIALSQQYHSKMKLYETVIFLCQDFIHETDPEKLIKIEQSLWDLKIALALQANKPVIKALNQLLPLFQAESVSIESNQTAIEKLLMAMRQDLGQTNYFTMKKELKKMFTPLK